jgi:acetoin utilization protein AcuB
MFYVYDIDGIRFRGPMEALERERRVEKSEAVPPLREGKGVPFSAEGAGARAAEAYRRATRQEEMIEPLVHIYQIMTNPVSTIGGETSLVEAWKMLSRTGRRQLVIISEKKQVIGMLSDRDILKRINVVDGEVDVDRGLTVSDVMQREVITTDSMSDIRRVARVMAFYHVDAMPVMGTDDRLVGIVTRGDILRGFAENPKLNLWA